MHISASSLSFFPIMGKRNADKKNTGRKKSKARRDKRTLAEKADKYVLYQKTVQEPSHEVEFFDRVYRQIYKDKPRILREDFCGTFAVCCEWARKRDRFALGVDLDPEPLQWGREHNLSKLKPEAQSRIKLLQQDVRTVNGTRADVLAAQNFSFWLFMTRNDLRDYFKIAHKNLSSKGIMVLDMMGGPDSMAENHRDERKYGNFTYIWEQAAFNPVDNTSEYYISFKFKDGSRLKRVFGYRWRFWSIPEVRELLAEAGFSRSYVYWEGVDKDGEGNGVYKKVTQAANDPAWVAYIVAVR